MPADISSGPVPHAPAITELLDQLRKVVADVASPPELLDLAGTMTMTSQSKSSIYRGIAAGEFPPSVATPSGPRWRRKDLLKWIEKLRN
jgi:predicted DNA-binding transcriptional regulator AlpA